jgi:hypothetical protein
MPRNLAFGREFTVVEEPRRPKGAPKLWAKDLVPSSRLSRLGFFATLRFEAIDGIPIRRRSDLQQALERLPAELPGSVLLMGRFEDTEGFEKEVHFVSRDVVDHLGVLLKSASFHERAEGARPHPTNGPTTLGVNDLSVSFDPHVNDEATKQLNRVAAAMHRAAHSATRRSVVPRRSDDECAELDQLPTSIYLSEGKHTLALAYVDWMVH